MATQDQMKDDQEAYASAFNEEDAPKQEMSEDEAFGITPEEPKSAEDTVAEDAAEGQASDQVDVAIVIDGEDLEKQAQDAQARQTAESAGEQAGMSDTPEVASDEGAAEQVAAPTVDMEKEIQRLKSWEGRLKAMEAKLKGAGADTEEEQAEAVSEAIEKASDATDTPADEEKVEQIAEQVEDGTITPEQAMKQLAEDFGDDFVKMIEAIAVAKAREAGSAAASELKGTVDEIIADIVDTKARTHFEQIADAHPDFNEIGASEEFKTYVESLPEGQKEQAMEVVANGSAKQIIKLLNGFKAANEAGAQSGAEQPGELTEAKESIVDEVSDEQLDAAEGVRSSGMKLPDEPKNSSNYEDAWNEY